MKLAKVTSPQDDPGALLTCLLPGVAGVAHIASILTFDPDPDQVIPGVIAGAVNAATSASKEPLGQTLRLHLFLNRYHSTQAQCRLHNQHRSVEQ